MQEELIFRFIVVSIIMVIMIFLIGAIFIIRAIKSSSAKIQFDEFKKLANDQLEATSNIHAKLEVLTDKVNSIEKLLKEVE